MNWLLLRGLIREQAHWSRFAEIFREVMGPGHTVHMIDFAGVGTEFQRSSPGSIAGIRKDVRDRWLEAKLSAQGPWSVLAISLGGMVALDWASAHPDDFQNLVVVNSSAGNLSWPIERLRPKAVLGALTAGLEKSPVVRERNILLMTTRLRADLDELAQSWARVAELRPVKKTVALAQLKAALGFRAPSDLKPKVLVLSSECDEFTNPSCSRALSKHLSAPLSVHPTAGHDISLDDPVWVSEQIKGSRVLHLFE
jgi:pimeloyl-[acyl-carrier protein] methyl ester esterase